MKKNNFSKLLFKGGIGGGTIYVIAILALLVVFGATLTRGVTPPHTEPTGSAVTIVPPNPSPGQSNLQLYTFGYTTPAPTVPPQPTQPPDSGVCTHETTQKAPRTCACDPAENDWVFCKENPCGATDPYDITIGQNEPGYWGIPPDYTCAYTKEGNNPLYQSKKSDPNCYESCIGKPVIYLYPTTQMLVDVKLTIPGRIYVSDPSYTENGWKNVLAKPDGSLVYNGAKYNELYYESEVNEITAPDNGIVIKSSELKSKLREIITKLGLKTSEQNEFLDYWLPKLQKLNTPYILFSLIDPMEKERIDHVDINPKPNTKIEFLVYFKSQVSSINSLKPPTLPSVVPQRIGFTTVEWGGTIGK